MSFDGALALRYIASVINAGGSLDDALRTLVDEAPEPLRRQARSRLRRQAALSSVAERAECLFAEPEFRLARAALALTHEAGGSVGLLLERCARQMEERRRWSERRKALSAQSVVSAWVVGAMPIGLVGMLALIAPDYLEPLVNTAAGRACMGVAALLLVSGFWMVRRMVASDE